MKDIIDVIQVSAYGEKKHGIWGTLGSGAGCDVHFIQTVLTGRDLDNIKLISDIPESKKWSIKDLFQRNIDQKRVEEGLVQYLNDPDRIKFFNPITLILLPHNTKNDIIKDIPFLSKQGAVKDASGITFDEIEYDQFYKLGFSQTLQIGKFEWNKENTFVVAIDGQHRLSALKKLKQSGKSTFKDWKIPAVLLCIHKEDESQVKVSLLEAVRRVFIDINNKSERITEARKILLNDALVLDVVSQEIIEFSHSSNDSRRVPLVFFNWRGDNDKNKKSNLASILSVEEINKLLIEYFQLPSDDNKDESLPMWFATAGIPKGELSYKSAGLVRNFANKEFVPGFHVFLNSIEPYQNYLQHLNDIFSSIEGQYCFEKDAYGSVDEFDSDKELYYLDEYKKKIEALKSSLPQLLNMDIGFRALIYVYSRKDIFDKIYQELNPNSISVTWDEHAKRISIILNTLVKHGWFNYDNKNKIQYKFLTGLVYSITGNVVNYRIEDVPSAYGALLMRLSINLLGIKPDNPKFKKLIDPLTEDLNASYLKDIKRKIRAEKAPSWTKTNKELSKEIQKEGSSEVEKLMAEFEKTIEKYSDFAHKYESR
jgi:hypothetical protein